MTKEELEKEAVEYAEKINLQNVNISGVVRNHISQAYLAGAEPREKQIEIDAKQIRALQKQNGELTDKLAKAKEIIKTFLGFAEAFGYSPSMDKFITETEQFISEVKK